MDLGPIWSIKGSVTIDLHWCRYHLTLLLGLFIPLKCSSKDKKPDLHCSCHLQPVYGLISSSDDESRSPENKWVRECPSRYSCNGPVTAAIYFWIDDCMNYCIVITMVGPIVNLNLPLEASTQWLVQSWVNPSCDWTLKIKKQKTWKCPRKSLSRYLKS